MRTAPIVAARVAYDTDGTPLAPDDGDLYHARHGALEQARHVFLAGNGLPARWRGHERFVILETGFGLGNNFLATWLAWRDDAQRCANLHFISIESRPPCAEDLAALPRDPALAPLATQLAAAWPPLTWNLHRLSFGSGRVQLLLAFGDVSAWLPQIDAAVDAFFLDGFAPAKNPHMWEARLFKAMARIAAPQASAATWSVARPVRDGLRAAGFDCTRAAGSGGKRHITIARFAPGFAPRSTPRRTRVRSRVRDEPVLIIGGGLAGCATAWALAEQGIASSLFERSATIASAGSGNAAGLVHGVVHRDDGRHARFNRAAALEAHRQVAIAIGRHGVGGAMAGLLRVESQGASIANMRATTARLGLPADYVRAVTSEEASGLAGVDIEAPAWFYPGGGWVDPRGLARSFIERAADRIDLHLGVAIAGLRRDGGDRWLLLDATGQPLASATTVVLANAGAALDLLDASGWPIERRRGQVSAAAAGPRATLPRLPLAGAGYVLPPIDEQLWFGATSQADDDDVAIRREDHRENLDRLGRLLPNLRGIDCDSLRGRVSFRYSSVDRLPIVGAVPLSALGARLRPGLGIAGSPRPEQPRFAPRAPGLFVFMALGSRGIAWSALGAQVLASAITGSPAPLEADLLDAIDPARFASRSFRRAGAAAGRQDQRLEGPIAGGSAGA